MENRKLIKCEHGEIKNLTLEETLNEFNKMAYSRIFQKWARYYGIDEIKQMSYLGVMKAYNRYDSEKCLAFIPYAQKIISHSIITQYESDNRQKRGGGVDICSIYSQSKDDKESSIGDTISDTDLGTEDKVLKKELINKINESLEVLSDDYKNIVNLHFIKGNSYSQIGAIYGVTRQSIASKVKYIKKILKEEFIKNDISMESLVMF